MDITTKNTDPIRPLSSSRGGFVRRLSPAVIACTLFLGACGGGDDTGSSTPKSDNEPAESAEAAEQPATDPAPDLTPDELCDLVSAEDLMTVIDAELDEIKGLDQPPQCSISYGNSQARRDTGAANGTNLLVIAPTSEDLEGKTGQEAMDIATQYAFNDGDPEPVDVAEGGLSNGKFLYYSTGGRIVGLAGGDGTSPEELIQMAQLTAPALAP